VIHAYTYMSVGLSYSWKRICTENKF